MTGTQQIAVLFFCLFVVVTSGEPQGASDWLEDSQATIKLIDKCLAKSPINISTPCEIGDMAEANPSNFRFTAQLGCDVLAQFVTMRKFITWACNNGLYDVCQGQQDFDQTMAYAITELQILRCAIQEWLAVYNRNRNQIIARKRIVNWALRILGVAPRSSEVV